MLSTVLHTSEVKKGQELGDRNIAQEDKKSDAILGGYAQGLPRDAAVEGHVLINGPRCLCACKAFMEFSIIDFSACEFPIKPADPVEMISDNCRPFDLATTAKNIPEIFFAVLSHLIQIKYTLMRLKRGHAH